MVESTVFFISMEALEVSYRVESVIFYGTELLALAPGNETRLNELQAAWARIILEIRNDLRLLSSRLSIRDYGWSLRLGVIIILNILLNKILLLLDLYPIKTLIRLTLQLP